MPTPPMKRGVEGVCLAREVLCRVQTSFWRVSIRLPSFQGRVLWAQATSHGQGTGPT